MGRELLGSVSTLRRRVGLPKLAQRVSFISLETRPLLVTALTYLRETDGGTPYRPAFLHPKPTLMTELLESQKVANLPAEGTNRLGPGSRAMHY